MANRLVEDFMPGRQPWEDPEPEDATPDISQQIRDAFRPSPVRRML